jgi:hypothetical protein
MPAIPSQVFIKGLQRSVLFLFLGLMLGCLSACNNPVKVDLSTPQTTFASYQAAVDAWDVPAMYRCMHDSHMDVVSLEEYTKRITPRQAELQGCFAEAAMGGRILDEGDRIIFDINGCAQHPQLELSFILHKTEWSIFYF